MAGLKGPNSEVSILTSKFVKSIESIAIGFKSKMLLCKMTQFSD